LQTLEREVLGLARVGDLPGAEIPAVYAAYLRQGAAEGLRAILDHNALDILSMVALVGVVGQVLSDEEDSKALGAGGCLAVGALHERMGDPAARGWLRRAVERAATDEERWEAAWTLSLWEKRRGEPERALALWADLRAQGRPRHAGPWEEAAKVAEHRRRDLPSALELVDEAIALGLPNGEGLPHRRERLLRRLGTRKLRG
ncbi:MAG: ribonuclease H-like domain-containing protein, partial [Myxococcales bacterium]|nr:ribonuclease H-like domain-containing protein [Myxococcales bacterium]